MEDMPKVTGEGSSSAHQWTSIPVRQSFVVVSQLRHIMESGITAGTGSFEILPPLRPHAAVSVVKGERSNRCRRPQELAAGEEERTSTGGRR